MSRSVVIPVLLCALALLDAGFAGFRGSIGRDAALVDHRFNLVAAAWGVLVGALGLGIITLSTVPWLVAADNRDRTYDSFLAAGSKMLVVYVPMAALNLLAICFYVVAKSHEVRAVAMTVVLGPFTLLRPPVIVGGALAAAWGSPLHAVWVGALTACCVTVAVGPVVGWWRFSRGAAQAT